MDFVRPKTLKYPNEVDKDTLANSKLEFMQKINHENLEHVKAKLAQGQRKGILDRPNVRYVHQQRERQPPPQ